MKAPDFRLLNQDNKEVSLKDYDKLVLYFYPKDNTPGCTIEGQQFTKYLPEFKKLGFVIVGVSADSVESHCKFIEKRDLKVELLSDPDKELINKFSVWQKKKFMGKEFMGIVRSTFIIVDGKVMHKWSPVKVKGHVEEVLEKVKEL